MPTSTRFHFHLILVHELFTIIMHFFQIIKVRSNTLKPELPTLSRILHSCPLLRYKLCSIQHLQFIHSLSTTGNLLSVNVRPYMKGQFRYLFSMPPHIWVLLEVHLSSQSYKSQQYLHKLERRLFWFIVKEWRFWMDFWDF